MGMRLILVRHGETDWNIGERVQGLSDVELNARGRQQAECIALALRPMSIVAVYSSPLKRALDTGWLVASSCGTGCEVDRDLIELDEGELDGLTYAEMRSRYADFMVEWRRDAASARLPGGECLQELQDRVWACVARIVASHPSGDVVIVSHFFALLATICKAMNLDLSLFRRLRLDVGSLSILSFAGGRWVLELLNDTCHLNYR